MLDWYLIIKQDFRDKISMIKNNIIVIRFLISKISSIIYCSNKIIYSQNSVDIFLYQDLFSIKKICQLIIYCSWVEYFILKIILINYEDNFKNHLDTLKIQ